MENQSFRKYLECLKFFEQACMEIKPCYMQSNISDIDIAVSKIFHEKDAIRRGRIFRNLFKTVHLDKTPIYEGRLIEAQTVLKNAMIFWLGNQAYENWFEKWFSSLVGLVQKRIGSSYSILDTIDLVNGLTHDRNLRNAIEHHRNRDVVIRETDDERLVHALKDSGGFEWRLFGEYSLGLDDLQNALIRHLSFASLMFLASSEDEWMEEHEAVKTAYIYILDNEITGTYYYDSARRHIPFLYPSRKFDYVGRLASEILENDYRLNGLDSIVKIERTN